MPPRRHHIRGSGPGQYRCAGQVWTVPGASTTTPGERFCEEYATLLARDLLELWAAIPALIDAGPGAVAVS